MTYKMFEHTLWEPLISIDTRTVVCVKTTRKLYHRDEKFFRIHTGFSYWHIQIVKNKHAWKSILIDSQKIQFAPSYPGNGWIPHQTGDDGGRWPGVSRRYFFHPRKYSLQPAILASGTFLARSRCYWQDIHISKRPHVVHSFSSSVSAFPLLPPSLRAFPVETVPTLLTTVLERIQVGAADW